MSEITAASQPSANQPEDPAAKKGKRRTMFALAFGYFIDQGEGQAMSVLFPTLQALWGLSYTQLGIIGTIRNILQSVTAPIWGYIADRYPRKNVIILGTGVWGIWTLLIGFSQDYQQLLWLRAISGIGLGCLMPAVFSLISDTYPPHRRGRALGSLEGLGVLGIVVFTLALGALATPELWRWGFFLLGGLSIVSGILVWFMVEEPVRGAAEPELAGKITEETASHYAVSWANIRKMLRIPTIWVAIAQGLAGAMPWVVMGLYMITWLVNDRGYDEQAATIAFAAIVIGTALSNVIGGFLGDWADVRSPKYGRVIVGQFSIIAGIPLTTILFTQTAGWPFGAVVALGFFTALLISWPGKGAKEPMIQAVTPPELRASAFAFIVFVENGFTAVAAFAAGWLADSVGLTQALVWMVPVPWIGCAAIFTLFYWTYPRDSMKLRTQMAERALEISV